MKPSLIIIDGSSYIFRAYYAIRSLSTSTGIPTNAIMGFTKMLLKLLEDFKPQYIAMIFDTKGENFRHKLYPKYKANRGAPPEDLIIQIPYIHKVSQAFNLPTFKEEGYEADDIIAHLCHKFREKLDITIVSGDKDLMQLIQNNVRMFDPMKNKFYDSKGVFKKLGIYPEELVDYLAITGDSSDNVPGITGIGPKGAVELIREYKSIDNIYKNIDKIQNNKQNKLNISKENAFLSYKLCSLMTTFPHEIELDDLRAQKYNNDYLQKLLNELELNSILKQLNLDNNTKKEINNNTKIKGKNTYYKTIKNHTELKNLIALIEKAEILSVDTETSSVEANKAKLIGISFAINEGQAYYLPLQHNSPNKDIKYELAIKELKPILENPELKKLGHNIKYDKIVFKRHNIDLQGIYFDTMLASYILHPELESHSLDNLAKVHLNYDTIKYSDIVGKGKNQLSFADVDIETATQYASEDADCTLKLFNIYSKAIKKHPSVKIFTDIEMPLLSVLADIELAGVYVDKNQLSKTSKILHQNINEIEQKIYHLAGQEFNINSTKQLSHILFQKLKITPLTKTKTGFSTSSDVLEKLARSHPIATELLEYRTLTKLKNTYIDALPELILPHTGRIHTSYNQAITSTGRLSSSKPNLQNIPIRTTRGEKIRQAFVAQDQEYVLFGADYNQIELRIMAHMANDQALIDDFRKGKDIHTQTACRVFNIDENKCSNDLRRQAKAINFGLIYGMGAYALAETLNISNKEAKELIEIYFSKYSNIKKYMEKTIKEVRISGYVETLFGRRRYFKDINTKNKLIQRNIERAAINAPIQGTAADIIKQAMIEIHKKLDQYSAKMILQVHDELVFELPLTQINSFKKFIIDSMENIVKLNVPLTVNTAYGKSWFEAH